MRERDKKVWWVLYPRSEVKKKVEPRHKRLRHRLKQTKAVKRGPQKTSDQNRGSLWKNAR